MKTEKFFNFIRIIAIAALICTIVVIVVMMAESAMPGDESAEQSNSLASSIQNTFGSEKEDVSVERLELEELGGFTDETYALSPIFYPENASDRQVRFSSSDEDIATVDDNGVVTFKSAGVVKMTVSLVSDPEISHTAQFTCYGTHPSKITSVSLKKQSFKVGKSPTVFLQDQDGNELSLAMFKPRNFDESLVYFTKYNIHPLAEGETEVKFAIRDGLGKKDYQTQTFGPFKITLNHNPDFVPPQSVVADDVFEIEINEEFNLDDLVKQVQPDGASKTSLKYDVKSHGKLKSIGNTNYRAISEGEAEVTIASSYNENIQKKVVVRVFVPKPEKLKIIAPDRAQTDKRYRLKAFGGKNYIENVEWSVVKGKATIDENGVLSDLKLGKTVVRATYKDDPTLFAEYEIKGVLYEDFAFSMRKLIGHFLLFVVIGFGLAYTYIFMIKPRVVALPLAVASGFGLAAVSEALQLPAVTTGRYATWSDVLIDFLGSLTGIAVALIILGIILLAFRLSKSRKEFESAFSAISAKTMFRSATDKKVQALLFPSAKNDDESAPQTDSAQTTDDSVSQDDAVSTGEDMTSDDAQAPAQEAAADDARDATSNQDPEISDADI